MKVLSKEDTRTFFRGGSVDELVKGLSSSLSEVGGRHSIPADSGRKTALSRALAYLLLRGSGLCLYVSGWGVWASAENLDLFYGYRRSAGEHRPLMQAPVQMFEAPEHDAFVSILSMALFFVWDAWLFDREGTVLIRINHDEWLEVKTLRERIGSEIIAEVEKYGALRLGR